MTVVTFIFEDRMLGLPHSKAHRTKNRRVCMCACVCAVFFSFCVIHSLLEINQSRRNMDKIISATSGACHHHQRLSPRWPRNHISDYSETVRLDDFWFKFKMIRKICASIAAGCLVFGCSNRLARPPAFLWHLTRHSWRVRQRIEEKKRRIQQLDIIRRKESNSPRRQQRQQPQHTFRTRCILLIRI